MINDPRFIVITETALDLILTQQLLDDAGIPITSSNSGLASKWLNDETLAFACGNESLEFSALISTKEIGKLNGPKDLAYGRIARLLKSSRRPPVHLPRSWSEFHHDNLISFFAESEKQNSNRWIAEIDGENRFVRFFQMTSLKNMIKLEDYRQSVIISPREKLDTFIFEEKEKNLKKQSDRDSFVKEFDLSIIGGKAVSSGRTYDEWYDLLSDEQKRAVNLDPKDSLRIVGPAGTGKTLALCMRAIRIAKDKSVRQERKKILIIAHSWAMAERIDHILTSLNYGEIPDTITVFPLLSVIQYHANISIGNHYEILGDDSQEGTRRVLEFLERVLTEEDTLQSLNVSEWIRNALRSPSGSNNHNELVFDLYEEITGVIAAQNIFPGDNDKIAEYFSMIREDSLPPFDSKQDRIFCMKVFEKLLSRLIDRGLITTDQLILDAIRVFETFSWNVRRQTEGYDYILVDELQLFGPQERLAISLLARDRNAFSWAAAEDPSQGIFSALYKRTSSAAPLDEIYLSDVHRFNSGLFEFVQFLYGKFPFNVPSLKISHNNTENFLPTIISDINIQDLPQKIQSRIVEITKNFKADSRLAIVVIGDGVNDLSIALEEGQLNPVQLRSFDDIERLSYQKKAIVVAPWQFIGGTQFSHVLLIITELQSPQSAFARLRELTAIYLGSSRASEHLEIYCCNRVPQILQDALDEKILLAPITDS